MNYIISHYCNIKFKFDPNLLRFLEICIDYIQFSLNDVDILLCDTKAKESSLHNNFKLQGMAGMCVFFEP